MLHKATYGFSGLLFGFLVSNLFANAVHDGKAGEITRTSPRS